MALVIRFINNLNTSLKLKRTLAIVNDDFFKENPVILTEKEVVDAKKYYFLKATEEVKHFAKTSEYETISKEEDGILYYIGRILPTEKINDVQDQMTDAMKDFSATSFVSL